MKESTKSSSVRYLYRGVWAVSVACETIVKVLCDNGQETNMVLKPSVHVFKLERGCQAVSKEFQLNKFLGDITYELAKVPSQTQNFTMWDQLVRPVHQALIKFPERLPEVASESRSGDELIESI